MKIVLRLLLVCLLAPVMWGQSSPYSNVILPAPPAPPITLTATGQTSTPIRLNSTCCSGTTGSGFASATITLTGTALSSVTFAVEGSADNGVNYFPLPISPILTPSTTASTITATTGGLYQVNLQGVTHVRFVTSGTFTATNVQFTVSATPVATVSRVTGGTGGGATFPDESSVVCSTSATTSEPCTPASVASVLATATGCTGTNVYSPATNTCVPNGGGSITPGAQVVSVYPVGSPTAGVTPSQMTTDPTLSDLGVRNFTGATTNATANCDLFGSCASAFMNGHLSAAIPSNSTSVENFTLAGVNVFTSTVTQSVGIPSGGQVQDPRNGNARYSVDSPIVDNMQSDNPLGQTAENRGFQAINVGVDDFPDSVLPNLSPYKTTQGSIARTFFSYASGQNVMDGQYGYCYSGSGDCLGFGNVTIFASAGSGNADAEGLHPGAVKISDFANNMVVAVPATTAAGSTTITTAPLSGTPNVGQDRIGVDVSQLSQPAGCLIQSTDKTAIASTVTFTGTSCIPADSTILLTTTSASPINENITSCTRTSGSTTCLYVPAATMPPNHNGTRTTITGVSASSLAVANTFDVATYGPTTVQVDSTHFSFPQPGLPDASSTGGTATPLSAGTQTLTLATTGLPTDVSASTSGLPSSGVAEIMDDNSALPVYAESVNYQVVDATHITLLNIHRPHVNNLLISIGGLAGHAFIPNANIQSSTGTVSSITTGTLFQQFTLLGCKSASNTCYAATNLPLGLTSLEGGVNNIAQSITSIACSSGVNTVTLASGLNLYPEGLPVNITGNSTINATGVVVTFTSPLTFTFSQACSAASGTGGTMTFNNGEFNFAPSFTVYYVVDPATGTIDGKMGIAPNSGTIQANDLIAFPNAATPEGPSEFNSINRLVPGLAVPPQGGWGGICAGLQSVSLACLHIHVEAVAPGGYIGYGGINRLPALGALIEGLYTTGIQMSDGELFGILHTGNSHGLNAGYKSDYVPEAFQYFGGTSFLTVTAATGQLTLNNIFGANQFEASAPAVVGSFSWARFYGQFQGFNAFQSIDWECDSTCNGTDHVKFASIQATYANNDGGTGNPSELQVLVKGGPAYSIDVLPTLISFGSPLSAPSFTGTGSGASIASGTPSNKDLVGEITLSGGTGVYSFQGNETSTGVFTPWTSRPECFIHDQTTPANDLTNTFVVTDTSITITSTGTTDVVGYGCIHRN